MFGMRVSHALRICVHECKYIQVGLQLLTHMLVYVCHECTFIYRDVIKGVSGCGYASSYDQ